MPDWTWDAVAFALSYAFAVLLFILQFSLIVQLRYRTAKLSRMGPAKDAAVGRFDFISTLLDWMFALIPAMLALVWMFILTYNDPYTDRGWFVGLMFVPIPIVLGVISGFRARLSTVIRISDNFSKIDSLLRPMKFSKGSWEATVAHAANILFLALIVLTGALIVIAYLLWTPAVKAGIAPTLQ